MRISPECDRPAMGALVEPLGLTLHESVGDLALELGFAPKRGACWC